MVGPTTLNSVVLIALAAAMAPLLAQAFGRWISIPSTVIEIVLGIVIGPAALGIAHKDDFVNTLSNFGLVLLFFLAGYEVDFTRIKGGPLTRAASSWAVSLVLGLAIGALLALMVGSGAAGGFTIGLALTTTALGAILPILRDAGTLPTPLGAQTMAVGAVGEFAPLVAVAVLLSGRAPLRSIVVLGVFALIAVGAAILAVRPMPPRMSRAITVTLGTSGQFAVRLIVLVVLALVWLATRLDLDVILGAFAAGITIRLLLNSTGEREIETIESKIDGLAFGLFIPFFFVVTGIGFDLRALVSSASAIALVPIGLVAFMVVRGLPVGFAFRRHLPAPELKALRLYAATELPLVVVITGIGVDNDWLTAATAAGLVGAAMLSVLLYPLLALRSTAPSSVTATATVVP